jgi:hypothetical protein
MTMVYAYSGEHEALNYEQARDLAVAFRDTDVEHSLIGICRVSDGAFEMVGFGVDADGYEFQEDSDYVTVADGLRLLREGLVYPMVAGASKEDFEDEALIARLTREQFGDF